MHIPTGISDEVEPGGSGDRDFLVTRDFGLMKETMKTAKHDLSPEADLGWTSEDSPLHELSL